MAHIQVVLRHDVDNLGHSGEVVRVKPGFARNFLVPRGLAVVATRGNLKQIEHERKLALARLEQEKKEAEKVAAQFENLDLHVAKQVGDEGKLYGSVTAAEIAGLLAEKGFEVDKRKLIMPEHGIKALGSYEVGVKLKAGTTAKLKIEVKTPS